MQPEPKPQFSIAFLLIVATVSVFVAILMSKYGVKTIGPWAMLAVMFLVLFMIGNWLAKSAQFAAANDPSSPVKVETFTDNFQASVLVGRLREAGINATAVGGFTSGFQAESPGYVDVVVPKSEIERAKQILILPIDEE